MTINIKAEIPDRWADDFCSMLKCMEYFGNIWHSGQLGFYSDGDGDFRSHFEIDYDYKKKSGHPDYGMIPEITFDAG